MNFVPYQDPLFILLKGEYQQNNQDVLRCFFFWQGNALDDFLVSTDLPLRPGAEE